MSDNPILDEVYAAREQILAECGGTMHGLFLRYSKRRPGVRYAELKPVRSRMPTRARPTRTSTRKKAARP
ncbi:MAG: hypothetical protein ILM98_09150 [Kiritimatiellae bacterium]|nr:hypothetical protein [Kiritimatiellia bacterium]